MAAAATGVVLVAMFTGAVATPRSDGDGVPAGGPLHWWGQRLAAATPVAPADLTSGCLDTVLVAFLHGLVPGILVSITDALGAIVVAVVAIIWGVVLLVGAIPAVVKAVRLVA